MRVDESIYFPNARFIEDYINNAVAENPDEKYVILECSAVNGIDTLIIKGSVASIPQRHG